MRPEIYKATLPHVSGISLKPLEPIKIDDARIAEFKAKLDADMENFRKKQEDAFEKKLAELRSNPFISVAAPRTQEPLIACHYMWVETPNYLSPDLIKKTNVEAEMPEPEGSGFIMYKSPKY